MGNSTLNLMIAGTEDGILMIEGAADFLPEETLIEALRAGHEAIKTICRALRCGFVRSGAASFDVCVLVCYW